MKRMRDAILPQIHQIGRIGSRCKKPTPERVRTGGREIEMGDRDER
jgi:hypothetical protein